MTREIHRHALRKRTLFRSLGYEPHPGQALVHRSRATRRVLACGVRWGKTTAAAMETVAALLEPREQALGWVVGPTYEHSERIFEKVASVMEKHLAHRIRRLDRRGHQLVIHNLSGGLSELQAKSADNSASLLGDGIDFLIVDEAAQIQKDLWESCLSQRLLDKHGWALLASTPKGREWFHRQWRRGQKGRDADYESWCSPSRDNPHLDRALIEAERTRLDPNAFAEQYEAQFLGPDLERCDVCGNPDPALSGMAFMQVSEEIVRCEDCKRPVDETGHTLVGARGGGKGHLMIFRGEWDPVFVSRMRARRTQRAPPSTTEAIESAAASSLPCEVEP
jgi:Terminase large subunit, T4likevirus-type, N-terminal